MEDQIKANLYIQEQVDKLASENAALKEQMATQELSWEQEKVKIMNALKSERTMRKQAEKDKKVRDQEKQEVISSLSQSPQQDSPAEEVQGQETPSRQLQDLRKSLLDVQKQVNELAPEHAALKEQMATKELSWEQEKMKIMKALNSETAIREKAEMDKKVGDQEKQEVISSLSQSPQQDSPAEELQDQETPSRQLQDLRKALLDVQKQVDELAPANAALKEQMATKELSWEQEKIKILKALKSERDNRKQAVKDRKVRDQEKQKMISSLSQSPQQDSPAEEVQDQQNQQTPSRQLPDQRKSLLDVQKQVNELASENAALKEQMATKELSWEQEKTKIMKALNSETAIREQAEADKKVKDTERQEEINSLSQSLFEKQNEILLVKRHWSAELKTLQENFDRTVSEIVLQEEDLITKTTSEKKALEAQNLETEAKLKEKERKIAQSEAEWKIKLMALEDQMRCQLATKESFNRTQELQRQSREMECCNKVNQMEEKIKLLTQQNVDLQVRNLSLQDLAQKTDKEKAQMKNEEKKAMKEAEKRLNEQRKEEEEREKKEKKKNEKREEEELKRQKRERKENEKREKEELKRQKRERKENEKREKEELKRQKKEKELREKKDKERK